MPSLSYTLLFQIFAVSLFLILQSDARALSPNISDAASPLFRTRQDAGPTFPADPPSCPKCAGSYDSINSCADAVPVRANVSMIIFNPDAFVDVIKCACTDTFQAAYPQCVDCFIRTNQTEFLSAWTDELPSIISSIQSICAIESTLLGNVSVAYSEVPASSVANTAALPTESGVLASSADQHCLSAAVARSARWTISSRDRLRDLTMTFTSTHDMLMDF